MRTHAARFFGFGLPLLVSLGLPASGAMQIQDHVHAALFGFVDGEVKVWSAMGNVIYDFLPDSNFRPFIGAGVGGTIGAAQ